MAESTDQAEVSIPVTNLDDENASASTASAPPSVDQEAQQQQYQFSSPTNVGLMVDDSQTAHHNQGFSPALQLESSLLNESTIDSFVQPGDGLKPSLPQLESTRISSTYPPADFESEQDISKVQSEPGDSDNPFNAGFVKEEENSGLDSGVIESILAATPKQETSLESSVFEPETGNQQTEMSEHLKENSVSVTDQENHDNDEENVDKVNGTSDEKGDVEGIKENADDSCNTDNSGSVEIAEEAVEILDGLEDISNEEIIEENDAEITSSESAVGTNPGIIVEAAPEVTITETADATSTATTDNSHTTIESTFETALETASDTSTKPSPESANTTVENDISSIEETLPEDESVDEETVQTVKVLRVEADKNISRVESDGSILEKLTNESTCSDPEVEQLMKLPETVSEFVSKEGVKIYLVGTAHFSLESQEDVAKTILLTRPRVVMVELCHARLNILRFDDKTILEEAQNMGWAKIKSTLKQYGALQGSLYLLFLSVSADLTKQLGMAPGGEFRRAYNEARNVLGCRIHLGDRPIDVTLRRALAALSFWQKAKLVWHLMANKSSVSPEEVERCKKKDLLEEMLEEMTGEFPALSRVFVQERDLCLAHSLQLAADDAAAEAKANNFPEAPSVVGVVGIGHVAGIINYFGTVSEADVRNVTKVPPPTRASRMFVTAAKLSLAGLVAFGCYKTLPKLQAKLPWIHNAVFSR